MSSPCPAFERHSIGIEPRVTRNSHLRLTSTHQDATEFEMLALRYRHLVLAIVCRITRNMVEAEDVTQQALMKAFANYGSFAGRSSFSTWLISIARNEALMWRRKAQRSREIAMAELATGEKSEGHLDFQDSRPNPEIVCLQNERSRLLSSELKKVRPAVRKVLELCDLNEQSGPEAATALGISATAVKSRRFRGRAILRQKLESRLFPPKSRSSLEAEY